jgi:hypothetical protein
VLIPNDEENYFLDTFSIFYLGICCKCIFGFAFDDLLAFGGRKLNVLLFYSVIRVLPKVIQFSDNF